MINYNSPIMDAINNQNQMINPYIQLQQPYIPQPMGNMINMANGYNQPMMNMGQYYGGFHTGYYNPYLAQQRQKQIEAQQRQEQIQNAETFKSISRRINKMMGKSDEEIEEHVKQYDPQFVQMQRMTDEQKEELNISRLFKIDQRNIKTTTQDMICYNNMRKERDRMAELIPEDMGLADFFEAMGEEANRMQEEERKRQQKQLNKLYNSEAYNRLIGMHNKSSGYFSSIYGNQNINRPTNIDDMEITLPSSIQEKINARKMAFLNSIQRG